MGTDLVGSAEGAVGDEKASRARDVSPGLDTSSPSTGGATMASLIAKAEKTDIRRRGPNTLPLGSASVTKLTNTVRRDGDQVTPSDIDPPFDRRIRELVGVVERRYFPSARVWEEMFSLIARSLSTAVMVSSLHPQAQTQAQAQARVETALREIYTRWKCQDIVQATLGMAGYYLEEGKGAKCVEVIGSVRDTSEKMEVEAKWRGIVKDFDERRSTHRTNTNTSNTLISTDTDTSSFRNRNRNRNRDGDSPGKSDPKHNHHDHGIDGIEAEEEDVSDTADAGKGETQDEGDSSSESGSVRELGGAEDGCEDGDEEDEMLIVQ